MGIINFHMVIFFYYTAGRMHQQLIEKTHPDIDLRIRTVEGHLQTFSMLLFKN